MPQPPKNGKAKMKTFNDLCAVFTDACSEIEEGNGDPVTGLIENLRTFAQNVSGFNESDQTAIKVVNLLLPAVNVISSNIVGKYVRTHDSSITLISSVVRRNSYEIDKLNQDSRKENIHISRLQEVEGTDDVTIFKQLCEKIEVDVKKEDIVACHGVGDPKKNPRPMLIRFVTRDLKFKIFTNKKKLKDDISLSKGSYGRRNVSYSSSFNKSCLLSVSSKNENLSENGNSLVREDASLYSSVTLISDESSNESFLNQEVNPRSIKIYALNVCGIISKLKFPDLEEKCADYDILCFCESKLDNLDEVEFSNFVKLPPLNRKGAKHKSGGIVVFVKEFLYSNIEVLECSSENALWFIVNNILYEPVLFGACYIPPESSDYSSIDIFDVIETELLKNAVDKNCKVCLLGDFNAHTGKKDDFVEMNHYVSESVQLDKEIKQNFDFVDLDALGICTKRSSLDKSVDNYGNRLLLLCKDLNLLIANGRLFKDKNIGALTCKESTVVDYCIMSPELFTNILDFEILPYDPMLSDVHNAIYIEMSSKDTCMPVVGNINVDIDDSSVVTKCKWENDKYHEFNDCIDEAVIHSIVVKLEEIDTDLIDNIVVNSIVDECNSLILQAASKCDLLLEKKVIRKVDNSLKKRKKLNSAQDENDDTFENIDVDNITSLNTEVNRAISENEMLPDIEKGFQQRSLKKDVVFNPDGYLKEQTGLPQLYTTLDLKEQTGLPQLCTTLDLKEQTGLPQLCTTLDLKEQTGLPQLCTTLDLKEQTGLPQLCTTLDLKEQTGLPQLYTTLDLKEQTGLPQLYTTLDLKEQTGLPQLYTTLDLKEQTLLIVSLISNSDNSRTSRDVEYIEIVHSQHDIVDTDNVDILNNLELYDMSKVRCSMDTSKNAYGNMLLEMCKNNNIIILNGRVNGDKEGKFTCRQASVVDYFICTYDFLCFVVNMYVQDFSKLFSDVHSPLILSLNFEDGIEEDVHIAENSVENAREVKRVQKWDVEKKNDFVEFIDKDKISDLVAELESVDSNHLSQGKINEVVEKLTAYYWMLQKMF
ncbi:unnamed protein product [Mytilus edulis]|uniref:Endonuclease/exonuclease/phosphatase domain-containing protein n=1 Tax=Mytilus edulis TaxID=6550 RepID=A0A8S3RVV1_MYTED|nr:unnamed protein product [Mytilus edulis]